MTRNPIGKKMRFEVFKRDSFTCQYCGSKSPEVVLHVDHVEPVKEGGSNDILNLVTSCDDCNSGKGARRLSDESAITKSRRQAELLQERREQIEMIAAWHAEVSNLDTYAASKVASFIERPGTGQVNEHGIVTINKWIKKFGLAEVMTVAEISFSQYYRETFESFVKAFEMIPRIANCRRIEKTDPVLAKAMLYRGILRKRLSYVQYRDCLDWLKVMLTELGEDETSRICNECRSWTNFKASANEAIENYRRIDDQLIKERERATA